MTRQRMKLAIAQILLFLVTIFAKPPSAFAGPVFFGLGDLPGGSFLSRATAVSADGATVVGASRSASGTEAFRWTRDGGMIGLGDLPGGDFRSLAFGVSSNGAVIVGESKSATGLTNEAFRWEGGTMNGLGDFSGGLFFSKATAVSGDGTVIVGEGVREAGTEAFRWTAGTGLVGLGDLPGGRFQSQANAVSADGSVVVGSSQTGNADGEAFRWTAETGMVGLGFLPGGGGVSGATGVSSDGTVIVGFSDSAQGQGAVGFRWTPEVGMLTLGDLRPLGLSADGSLVVGWQFVESGFRSVIWDEINGLRRMEQVLESDFGLDLTGWTLEWATDISADGMVIVGRGINPLGNSEGWLAVIPEPSTLILLAIGASLIAKTRHRSTGITAGIKEPQR